MKHWIHQKCYASFRTSRGILLYGQKKQQLKTNLTEKKNQALLVIHRQTDGSQAFRCTICAIQIK